MSHTKLALRHPYVSLATPRGPSYGGSQTFSADKVMHRCGCGVVAALDLLLYLQKRDKPFRLSFLPPEDIALDIDSYVRLLDRLSRSYLPLIYPTGINGLLLSAGMNLLFIREGLPFRASWRMTERGLWRGLDEMLRRDLPVILSVGPNFPRLLSGKEKASLLRRDEKGELRPAASVSAHYMTVTAREGEWLRLSSWGEEYWLSIPAYEEYIRQHSSYIFSNILYLREN